MITLQVAAACLGAFLIFHIIRVERRIADVPGPFIARFTDWWRVYHYIKGDWGETILWWHQRYGDLIRTGPNRISVGDPLEVPRVYQVKPLLHKGTMYRTLIGWFRGENVAGLEGMVDEVQHANTKRVIASAYSWNAVVGYEPQITYSALELIDNIGKHPVIDINDWIPWWGIDSMNRIAFSSSLGFMKNARDVGRTLEATRKITAGIAYMGAFPTIFMWIAWALSTVIGPSGRLVNLCMGIVNSRLSGKDASEMGHWNGEPILLEKEAMNAKGDLLDAFIKAGKEQPKLFPHSRVIGMTFTTILAGSDTTAYNLSWTIYYLLKNPAYIVRLQEELDRAAQQGELSYPPSLAELSKLPYLEAVIKEGLRYAVLLQMHMERVVPKEGMEICGYSVPGGITVGCISKVIHMNKEVYGEDAERFRPERWLEASPEKLKVMERCGIWFGAGKHTCIGQHFARAKTLKVLSMILMNFNVS
ncbi:Cytochrome P450 [Penicillium angulare]|uniref:Cytochrome P450 n=1 Tax=Penicillium angulare TaxID=116970 RepID=A0A9W9FAX7_9EURO|nr:Cytochrome P450 [Penicillium angulare]